ncbi:hypothetical protein FRB94_011115 [Tulasnella sp. JGI-2019a]|nr:hypothetical protein FRB94_011115 [Tulasnella sp. JGI-2019a]
MRSSSFLIALQAGCLSLAAPTAFSFGSHQERCEPGSVEALEAEYYNYSKEGHADHRKVVEMCIRLTLPAPCSENRPRTPSAVELVLCDSAPEAPESTQMYIRVTLPDSSMHEGHRTPSIVDPNPFPVYSGGHKHGPANHGPSGGEAEAHGDKGAADDAGAKSADESSSQLKTGSQGHSFNSGKTGAVQHQGPAPGNRNGGGETGNGNGSNSGNNNGGTSGGKRAGAQEPSRQNQDELRNGGSSAPSGPSSAGNGGSSGSDEDGDFRHGTLRSARPSPKSGSETNTGPTDDGSLFGIKVHAAAFGEHEESGKLPNPAKVNNGGDLTDALGEGFNVKVHAAALGGHSGSGSFPGATGGAERGDALDEVGAAQSSSVAEPDDHLVDTEATTPDGNGGPDVREPNPPEPHALLEVKGTAPKKDDDPSALATQADDGTHRATLLNIEGGFSPKEIHS